MRAFVRISARTAVDLLALPIGLTLIVWGLLRATRSPRQTKPRLSWQSTPIKSLAYMALAMREAGYKSETAVIELYSIYRASDFDHLIVPRMSRGVVWNRVAASILAYRFFACSLAEYDVFFMYFDGGVLRRTVLARWELKLLRVAGKKVVLIPYGSDSFVYDRVTDPLWRHGLMTSYPDLGNKAAAIEKRIRRMTADADVVVACLFHYMCLPRWDVLPLTCYPVDTRALRPVPPRTEGVIRIAHAANHRGIKGTEFVIAAIDALRDEGHEIEFDLIEGVTNEVALARIAAADIILDQLVAGYALAALEAMALGKVVVSPISGSPAYDLFRVYSYLDECPIVSASQKSILEILRQLIGNRQQWPKIGAESRAYVERRHSFEASAAMFTAVLKRIWYGEDIDLINLYHPLLEKKRSHGGI